MVPHRPAKGRPGPVRRCRIALVCLLATVLLGLSSLARAFTAGDPGVQEGVWPQPAADYLLVSNSPETVRRPGILLEHVLEPGALYRLFVHHLNATGDDADLAVTLEPAPSASSSPGRARVAVAGIGISPQPFTSGWTALQTYAAEPASPTEYALTPGEERNVWRAVLAPGHVATGYWLLETDQPTRLRVRLGAGDGLLDPDGVHARGLFPEPQVHREISFSLAERVLDIPFGTSGAFRDVATGTPLKGDYGIDYRLRIAVHNPFDVPMPLHLSFIPRGGDGRLLALVDGRPHTTDRTFSGHYYHVRRWVIHPGRTRTISLWTAPVSAMGYPAVLRLSTHLDAGWPRHPTSPAPDR